MEHLAQGASIRQLSSLFECDLSTIEAAAGLIANNERMTGDQRGSAVHLQEHGFITYGQIIPFGNALIEALVNVEGKQREREKIINISHGLMVLELG